MTGLKDSSTQIDVLSGNHSDNLFFRVACGIETVLSRVCGLLLLILLIMSLSAVSIRYLGIRAFVGIEELLVWLLLLLIGCGFPLAADSAFVIRFDLSVLLKSEWFCFFQMQISRIFILISSFIFLSGGWNALTMLGGISPLLGLPEWLRPLLFMGSALCCLVLMTCRAAAENSFFSFCLSFLLAVLLFIFFQNTTFSVNLPVSLIMGMIVLLGMVGGVSLPHVFIVASFSCISFGSALNGSALVVSVINGMQRYMLLAIPFFLLAGAFLSLSGLARNLVRFANALVGHYRGGLAQTVLLTGVLFSGISGSSIANAAFNARTFIPQLIRNGFKPERAGAIIASVAVLDNIIPPSIAFLILGTAVSLPIGSLLVGGLFAGLLMALTLALVIFWTSDSSHNEPKRCSSRLKWFYGWKALPAFGLGLVIIAGIRFGLVSPTEAASLAAFYTCVMAVISCGIKANLLKVFNDTAKETTAILLLIGSADPFSKILAMDGVAEGLISLASAGGYNPFLVIILINIILLIAGLFLDIGAGILLLSPVLLPVAMAAGIDPVHFGVILVVNLMIGGITPPVGILVQVVSGISRIPALSLFRESLPFFLALVSALALMSLGAAFFALHIR